MGSLYEMWIQLYGVLEKQKAVGRWVFIGERGGNEYIENAQIFKAMKIICNSVMVYKAKYKPKGKCRIWVSVIDKTYKNGFCEWDWWIRTPGKERAFVFKNYPQATGGRRDKSNNLLFKVGLRDVSANQVRKKTGKGEKG